MKFILGFLALLSFPSISQTSNYWTKMNDFGGLKRTRAVSFTIGNYAYVGTGVDTAEQVHKDFWKYDPLLDSWSQVADLPGSARRNAVAFSNDSYGFVGTGISHAESAFGSTLSDFWRYDPSTNSWSSIANYPGGFGNGVYFATGFGVGGKGYVCGGKLGSNNYISQFWEYNPVTNNWTQKANFPGGVRYQLCSFVVNNSAFVGLGTDNDMYRNDFYEYKPSTNQWIQRADLPSSERSGVATFSIDDRGFVCMGNNGGLLDDLWEYNPSENEWVIRDNYGGSARKWSVGFSLNDRGYVGTGQGYSGKKESMYMYTPVEWVSLNKMDLVNIEIHPNPTSDYITINNWGTIHEISIVSLGGQEVLREKLNGKIDVSQLTPANYILIGFNEQGNLIGKENIVIQ